MFTDKNTNQNIGCHMAENDINFDMPIFIQRIKQSLVNSDQFFLAGKLLVDIISR